MSHNVISMCMHFQPKDFYNWTIDTTDSLGVAIFKKRVTIGMAVNDTANSVMKATAYFNGQPFHARPIAVRTIYFYHYQSYKFDFDILLLWFSNKDIIFTNN